MPVAEDAEVSSDGQGDALKFSYVKVVPRKIHIREKERVGPHHLHCDDVTTVPLLGYRVGIVA